MEPWVTTSTVSATTAMSATTSNASSHAAAPELERARAVHAERRQPDAVGRMAMQARTKRVANEEPTIPCFREHTDLRQQIPGTLLELDTGDGAERGGARIRAARAVGRTATACAHRHDQRGPRRTASRPARAPDEPSHASRRLLEVRYSGPTAMQQNSIPE